MSNPAGSTQQKEIHVNRRLASLLAILALVIAACGGTTGTPDPDAPATFVERDALVAAISNENPDLAGGFKISPSAGAQASLTERTVEVLPRCYVFFEGASVTPSTGLAIGAPIGGQTCDAYPTAKEQPDGARLVGADAGTKSLWITRETSNISPIPGENIASAAFVIPAKAPAGSVWARVVVIKAGGDTTATPETLDALVGADLGTLKPVSGTTIPLDLASIEVGEAAIVVVQLVWRTEDGLLRGMVAYPFSYSLETPVTIE